MTASTVVSRIQLIHYAFLAAPIAFAGFPLYILAPDVYATHHAVSLTTLGFVLLILRVFDAIQDPLIGRLSDRFPDKAFPVMLLSAIALVISIYALFNPANNYPVVWFAISMAVAVTAYSVMSINLATLGALWTSNSKDQTRISGTREAFGLMGLLLAVILPAMLQKILPANMVYVVFSLIAGGLMLMALLTFRLWFLPNAATLKRTTSKQTDIIKTLMTLPKKTRHIFLVYGLSTLASGIPAILVIFFVRDRLNAESYLGGFLLLYFLSGALAMPLWKSLSIRYGKHQAWLISMLLAVISFIWAFFLGTHDIIPYAIICVLSGIALGADLSMPPSILADDIHLTGARESTATLFSLLTLLAKAALALGTVTVFPLLDAAGFTPASHNLPGALLGLSAAYALIPCLIKLFAAALLYRIFIQPKGYSHDAYMENNSDRSSHHA